jgi:ribosome-associated protein
MAKRPTSTTEPPEDDEGATGRVSYRERSELSSEIAGLALMLVAMKPAQLAAMPLPTELAEAILQCQGFRKNARARQLRLIGKLLRQVDHEALRNAITQVVRGKGARPQREKTYEAWRERLLTGGDAALADFLAQHRDGDAQRLRQLVRSATRDSTSGKGKHAARDLLRMIREIGEASARTNEASEASPDDV